MMGADGSVFQFRRSRTGPPRAVRPKALGMQISITIRMAFSVFLRISFRFPAIRALVSAGITEEDRAEATAMGTFVRSLYFPTYMPQ